MSLHRTVCCSEALLTDFCPHCGNSKERAEHVGASLFPYDFSTTTAGQATEGSSSKQLLLKTLKITDPTFLFKLEGCDRRATLNWRLSETGQLDLISVVVDGEEYKHI